MELHFGRLRLLFKKRSIGGWVLFSLAFFWQRLGDWQNIEWLAQRVSPQGLPRMLQPNFVTLGLFAMALVWFAVVLLWPRREVVASHSGGPGSQANEKGTQRHNVSQARAGRELLDPTLKGRTTSLAEEILRFLKDMGPKPTPPIEAGMTDEQILDAGSEEIGAWVGRIHHTYFATFRDRVNSVVHELAAQGLSDHQLNDAHIDPQVQTAEQLRTIAEKLLRLSAALGGTTSSAGQATEEKRENCIVLRYARETNRPHRLILRVANVSSVGVLLERVNCSVVARYTDGPEEFPRQAVWECRDIMAAFSREEFDVHSEIIAAIGGRNAAFWCDIEVTAVYLDQGVEKTTPPACIRVKIEQVRLIDFPEG